MSFGITMEKAKADILAASYQDTVNGLRSLVYDAEHKVCMLNEEEGSTKENRDIAYRALTDLAGACLLIRLKLLKEDGDLC